VKRVVLVACVVLAAPAIAAPAPALPFSVDVLGHDEAQSDTLVVIADTFRFQIPQTFEQQMRDGRVVYSGPIRGRHGPGELTFWATAERFKGTLDALVARETAAVGATSTSSAPAVIRHGTAADDVHSRVVMLVFADRTELRTVVIEAGTAYIHHCETANVDDGWDNLGDECRFYASTFAVAQPPLPIAIARPPASPSGNGSPMLYESEIASTPGGWQRGTVMPWLDRQIGPFLERCLADARSGDSQWNVAFDVEPDGRASRLTATSNDKPVAAGLRACILEALAAHPLRVRGALPRHATHVSAMLLIPYE
jgi:hypothetical protein